MLRIKKFLFSILVSALIFLVGGNVALAVTNIGVSTNYAWNDLIGWIDFYGTNTVLIDYLGLHGYASTTSVGDIAFDCATTRNGNICATSNFKVTNDGAGNLSGWAWNDLIGWISFSCFNSGQSCISSNYQVTMDTNGIFHGYAWSDTVGWISFNCLNNNSCPTSQYSVGTPTYRYAAMTGSLESSTYDTGLASGAAFNSIMWQGAANGGGVRFQFASSNSPTGPWTYNGPTGGGSYYSALAGAQVKINPAYNNNQRYFRYMIFIDSNPSQTTSPQVDDILVSYSP